MTRRKSKTPVRQERTVRMEIRWDSGMQGEYVLFRDGHMCHGRKNCKNHILNVHRIESRKIGGDAPNNPAALCEDCRSGCRGAAFMGAMRESLS
ncbi:MAG: hypothetical protein LBU32_00520 [Clostridiales bacterium]|nr:hypothetical protein [Clostridiales bacterium]